MSELPYTGQDDAQARLTNATASLSQLQADLTRTSEELKTDFQRAEGLAQNAVDEYKRVAEKALGTYEYGLKAVSEFTQSITSAVLDGAGSGLPPVIDPTPTPVPVPTPPVLTPNPTGGQVAAFGKPTYLAQTGKRFEHAYGCRTFTWKGYEWAVREVNDILPFTGPQAVPEGERQAFWVDGAHLYPDGNLLLENAGIFGGVEIIAKQSMGYGTYTLEYSGDFDAMHPATVFGIFPYDFANKVIGENSGIDYEVAKGFTELDFLEISRWGNLRQKFAKGESTYYTDDTSKSHQFGKFYLPSCPKRLKTVATWKPGFFGVKTTDESGYVLADASSTVDVPVDNTQQLHINLWVTDQNSELVKGQPSHFSARGESVILHDFLFEPLS